MGITNPGEPYFKDGGWHWNGSAWIKGGLAFEYAGQLLGRVFTTTAAAGTNTLLSGAVPAGSLYVATAMAVRNANNVTTGRVVGIFQGSVQYWLGGDGGGAADTAFSWRGVMVAVAGDNLLGILNGCTAGDDIYFYYSGYIMRLT